MRKPRPIVYSLQEVTITREGHTAIIEYKDPAYGTTHFGIGAEIAMMTDQEIIARYNDTLRATAELVASHPYVAREIPLGSPQIEYFARADQWTPRGNVLRCLVSDTSVEGEQEPLIEVDGKELSWREFGRLLCTYAGWGMRIEFTPDDAIHRRPKLVVQEPHNEA